MLEGVGLVHKDLSHVCEIVNGERLIDWTDKLIMNYELLRSRRYPYSKSDDASSGWHDPSEDERYPEISAELWLIVLCSGFAEGPTRSISE
jgi:hypothetical protein